ncbi:alpha-hydroxy-acid oxidizing protein [Aquicoccus sp. SCR17]|nr:alpha-hydroxy-acid oxidizing protein [Carideicomes alvinocaridis]
MPTSTARPSRRIRRLLTLDDFEGAARRHLPRPLFGYVSGYAERGQGGAATTRAFEEIDFIPRALTDVSGRDLSVQLMGRRHALPFGIPPMGLSAAIAHDGDVALGRAAAAADIPFVLSASSLIPLERVAEEGQARWYQAYLPGEEERIETLVDRVAAAGYDTFVLTVDVPVAANRENNVRNGFDIPLKPSLSLAWQGVTHPRWLTGTAMRTMRRHGMPHFENMDAFRGPPILSRNLKRAIGKRDQLAWRHLELIRKRWTGRLVVKGIVAPEDALRAKESGADGVILSNHGGRQLDGVVAPLRMLPKARELVGEDFPVMLDSGIRRGTDVLKALALGADFVFVGRPFLYAAALGGEAGVAHAISILTAEIDRDLALLGVRRIDELGPHLLHDRGRPG